MRLNKLKSIISIYLMLILTIATDTMVFAEDSSATEKNDNTQKYYLGDVIKTEHDKGFLNEQKIEEGDPHYGWKLGQFYVDGFTATTKNTDNTPIFLKNVGDKVTLWFKLEQNIDLLNNDENLSISDDDNGYDEYFGIEKTDFGRGTLIIRKTDHTNKKGEALLYKDYLSANFSKTADTKVELCEEGDYEISLNYEIMNKPKILGVGIIPKYTDYKIFFRFSVRNGNCMVYPFDTKTKSELSNSDVIENGFYLDLAKSRYLDINIKKEVLNDGATGLTEDVRFNRPAKDGENYIDEGIYTITVSNKYTEQTTTKKIYVGTNHILKAVVANGLTVKEINDYISDGAKIDSAGKIIPVANKSAFVATESTTDIAETPTENLSKSGAVYNSYIYIIVGCVLFLIILTVIILILKSKKIKANIQNSVQI